MLHQPSTRQNTRGHVCCAMSYLAAQQDHKPAHFPVQWLLAALTKTGHLAAATVHLHRLAQPSRPKTGPSCNCTALIRQGFVVLHSNNSWSRHATMMSWSGISSTTDLSMYPRSPFSFGKQWEAMGGHVLHCSDSLACCIL